MTARRLLVVDDHADAAEALAMLLEALGHEVRVATNGAAALDAAAEFRPDTALLDLSLPDMTGYELAEQLRAAAPETALQIVAVTGWDSADEQSRARAAGFLGVLTKPVDFTDLDKLLSAPPAN